MILFLLVEFYCLFKNNIIYTYLFLQRPFLFAADYTKLEILLEHKITSKKQTIIIHNIIINLNNKQKAINICSNNNNNNM